MKEILEAVKRKIAMKVLDYVGRDWIFKNIISPKIRLVSGKAPASNTPYFELHLSGHPIKRITYTELELLFNPPKTMNEEPIVTTKPPEDQKPEEKAIIDRNSSEPQAWEEEFDRKVDSDNYKKEEKWGHDLVTPNDSLFDPEGYPESNFEIDPEKVKDFIRTLRQKDKERLMEGVCKMKHEIDPTINAKFQIGQISAYTEFIDLLNQIYE